MLTPNPDDVGDEIFVLCVNAISKGHSRKAVICGLASALAAMLAEDPDDMDSGKAYETAAHVCQQAGQAVALAFAETDGHA